MKRYYPWVICTFAMLMLTVSNGMAITGITAFDPFLLKEFDWTRGQLKLEDMFSLVLTALCAPFIGAIIDKVGVRRLTVAGSIALAGLYVAFSYINNLFDIYLINIGFAFVLTACGIPVAVIMVAQWFKTQRGLALGIAVVGSSLGSMVIPKLVMELAPTLGWRKSFFYMALIPAVLAVLALVFVRNPDRTGLSPWTREARRLRFGKKKGAQAMHEADMNLRQALGTRTFWILAAIAAITFWSMMALSANLILDMTGLGFSNEQAANAMVVLFGFGIAGNILFGYFGDVLRPKTTFTVSLAVMSAGTIIMATQSTSLVWFGLALTGMGWGGQYSLIQYQVTNTFGLDSAGKILGSVALMDASSGGLGIWLTAVMYDKFGSYIVPFALITVIVFIAFLLSMLLPSDRGPQAAPDIHPAGQTDG